MPMQDLLYEDITKKVIGCALKVHGYFGMGFPEIIYKRALLVGLQDEGLNVQSEIKRDIYYNGIFIGMRRLDLVVEQKVLIELKSMRIVDQACSLQVINYLKIFGLKVGLLLNFGTEGLQFKRFVY